MTRTTHIAKPEHEVAYQDLCALCSKTRERALRIVADNIEFGNSQVLEKLMKSKGEG